VESEGLRFKVLLRERERERERSSKERVQKPDSTEKPNEE
jgi:hypothetical protein